MLQMTKGVSKIMQIESFPLGPLGTNCYLISDESGEKGIVIDPGMNPEPLFKRVKGMEIAAILLTHAHFDHIGGVEILRKEKNAPVYIHPSEQGWLVEPRLNGSAMWGGLGGETSTSQAEHELHHDDELTLLGLKITVLHTPGHSPGSVSFVIGNHCFAGDALFAGSIGRTDLPGGNHDALIDAIKTHLFKLSDDTIVYPGHGPKTSIGREKRDNVYVGIGV
jgi:hydroxyacylglutathione hydrolase